ncbi:MAG: hypothetical protein QOI78_822 [Actinomycetota bacterium]|nr:hypothetical protein [Actinomycetota bacterium]
MGKLVVIKGDQVTGTDKHNVTGSTVSTPPVFYAGTGSFKYQGSITDQLSDFVRIGGTPVALVTSRSSLDPGEDAPPAGQHSGPAGSGFTAPAPNPGSLSIVDLPLGTGVPGSGAGSGLLTVNGVKVLLDGDAIDTCGPAPTTGASKVAAQGQDFVTCSA